MTSSVPWTNVNRAMYKLIAATDVVGDMEVWALKRLSSHPNISINPLSPFIEHHEIKDKIVIITEQLQGYRDLFDHINEHAKFSLTKLRASKIIKQVVDVIGFCFKIGVDHRGINEEKIMYNPSGNQIKLINFGSALVLSKHFSRLV